MCGTDSTRGVVYRARAKSQARQKEKDEQQEADKPTGIPAPERSNCCWRGFGELLPQTGAGCNGRAKGNGQAGCNGQARCVANRRNRPDRGLAAVFGDAADLNGSTGGLGAVCLLRKRFPPSRGLVREARWVGLVGRRQAVPRSRLSPWSVRYQ